MSGQPTDAHEESSVSTGGSEYMGFPGGEQPPESFYEDFDDARRSVGELCADLLSQTTPPIRVITRQPEFAQAVIMSAWKAASKALPPGQNVTDTISDGEFHWRYSPTEYENVPEVFPITVICPDSTIRVLEDEFFSLRMADAVTQLQVARGELPTNQTLVGGQGEFFVPLLIEGAPGLIQAKPEPYAHILRSEIKEATSQSIPVTVDRNLADIYAGLDEFLKPGIPNAVHKILSSVAPYPLTQTQDFLAIIVLSVAMFDGEYISTREFMKEYNLATTSFTSEIKKQLQKEGLITIGKKDTGGRPREVLQINPLGPEEFEAVDYHNLPPVVEPILESWYDV